MSNQPDKQPTPDGRNDSNSSPSPSGTSERLVMVMPADPPERPQAKPERSQGSVIAGMLYADAVRQRIGELVALGHLPQSAVVYAADLFERFRPRDPFEEMLIIQAIVTHARALHLNHLATRQERPVTLRTVNEYADRASNTFRRLMLALAEYRRPPRPAASFTAIGQANLAHQQVVVNNEKQQVEKPTNELGFAPTDARQAALPPERRGAAVASGARAEDQAVGTFHRAKNARGQAAVEPERGEARGAVGPGG